jgi:uncharacterized protein (DUF58 family)
MKLGRPRKFDAARQVAGALGYMALANQDGVSVTAISDRIVAELPAIRGRKRLYQLLQFLDDLQIDAAPVSLQNAVEAFVTDRPRRGISVVISDLFDPQGFESAVDRLAVRGFEPFLLQVIDDSEAEPALSGGVELRPAAGGRSMKTYLEEIDLINYRNVFREFSAACRRYCGQRSIGIVQTRTSVPFQHSILRMIRISTSRMYAP